jgi:amylosucrase
MEEVAGWGTYSEGQLIDLVTRHKPEIFNNTLVIPGFSFYWLYEM